MTVVRDYRLVAWEALERIRPCASSRALKMIEVVGHVPFVDGLQ